MGQKPDLSPIGTIKLIDVPKLVNSSGTSSVTYAQLYSAAVNGTISVSRSPSGARWLVAQEDLPSIIAKFSLKEAFNAKGKKTKAAKVHKVPVRRSRVSPAG